MIMMKELEASNLQGFLQARAIDSRLANGWGAVLEQQVSIISQEHAYILTNEDARQRVAQTAASIGESSSERTRISKEKRPPVKKKANIDAMDLDGKTNQKQLMTLVEEALKRKEQSRKDRALSGKGKRRSGKTSKKKNTQKMDSP